MPRLPSEVMTKEMATPVRTRRLASRAWVKLAMLTTRAVVASAPTKAKRGTVIRPRNMPVCTYTMMAPRAAPEEMPSRCGSARALRVTDCRAAPTSDRLAPTMAPSTTRGRRTSHTILSRPGDQVCSTLPGARWLRMTLQTISGGMPTAPTLTARTEMTKSRTTRPQTMSGMEWISAWRGPSTRCLWDMNMRAGLRRPYSELLAEGRGEGLDGVDIARPRRCLDIGQHHEAVVDHRRNILEGGIVAHEIGFLLGGHAAVIDDDHDIGIALDHRLPADFHPARIHVVHD